MIEKKKTHREKDPVNKFSVNFVKKMIRLYYRHTLYFNVHLFNTQHNTQVVLVEFSTWGKIRESGGGNLEHGCPSCMIVMSVRLVTDQ